MATSTDSTTTSNISSNERELCKYFIHGVCRFGDNCFNSHDRNSRPSTVCRYYLMGNCSFGDRCHYDHVRPKPQSSSNTNPTGTSSVSSNSSNSIALASNSSSPSSSSSSSTTSTSSSTNSTNQQPSTSSSQDNSSLVTRLINKPKLLTSVLSSTDNTNRFEKNSSSGMASASVLGSTTETTPSSYYEALTGAKSNTYNQPDLNDLNMFDENYLEYLKKSNNNSQTNTSQLCPIYEKNLCCPSEPNCQMIHGDICDICNTACLNPYDDVQRAQHRKECMQIIEKDMEEAFAVQRSMDKVCGICMEAVWEKDNEPDKRFGILENCNHIFCLICIRKWRASKSYENKIVKACPECRVKSDFVTPSKFWFENEESKKVIIQEYKSKLGKTACKYFKQGDGKCPFGNRCFYLHQNKDGTIAELPEPTKRHRFNRDGNLESYSNIVRIDFDFSDDDDDDLDILEFFRQTLIWDTETDSDFSDLFELSDEFLI